MKWTPIFEKDGQEFVVPSESMVGSSEHEAWKIVMGVSLVESVLLGFKHTGRYLELNDDGTAQVRGWYAKLGTWDVVILDRAAIAKAQKEGA